MALGHGDDADGRDVNRPESELLTLLRAILDPMPSEHLGYRMGHAFQRLHGHRSYMPRR
jgi:hypothetical protein